MPSYQIHYATVAGLPDASMIVDAVKLYGEKQAVAAGEFVVLDVAGSKTAARIALAYVAAKKINGVRPGCGCDGGHEKELGMDIEQVNVAIPFDLRLCTKNDQLKTYGPGVWSIEHSGVFLSGAMAFPTLISEIELKVEKSLEILCQKVDRLTIVGAEVSDYSHDRYMLGKYAPKFLDTDHGLDFVGEYVDSLKAITVQWPGASGKVRMKLTSAASFSFTAHEDDFQQVEAICTHLAGWRL